MRWRDVLSIIKQIYKISFTVIIAASIVPNNSSATPNQSTSTALKGWDYLAQKLIAEGIPSAQVKAAYSDPRIPPMEYISFRLAPKEPSDIYSGFSAPKKISVARAFIEKYRQPLELAERHFGTSKEGIVGILLVETHFGKNTGKEFIFYRLSRLANLRDPKNVYRNYQELKKYDSTVTHAAVEDRAKYLWNTFFPEVVATFRISSQRKFSPFTIKGSSAGAFGIPQFLPTSFLKFGLDGNSNGIVSLFEEEDAIFSVAKYLSQHGWTKGASHAERKKAIWAYNKSEPYVNTILKITHLLQENK
jgi:membrane-bound lytic murein transglycosylase B